MLKERDVHAAAMLWKNPHLPGVALDHVNAIQQLSLKFAALVSELQRLLLQTHSNAHKVRLSKQSSLNFMQQS